MITEDYFKRNRHGRGRLKFSLLSFDLHFVIVSPSSSNWEILPNVGALGAVQASDKYLDGEDTRALMKFVPVHRLTNCTDSSHSNRPIYFSIVNMSVKSELPLSPSTGPPQSFDPRRYQPTLPRLPETARQVFRDYSRIPEDKILDHIYQVRDKAWEM